MQTIEAGGHRIAYRRRGAGPPVVLLHGYVGDSRTFRLQLESLSDAFDVIAWDSPGCGGSSDPPEDWPLPEVADCLAAFIAALGIERPHVVGLSLGGGLAIELARRHPDLPRSLVLAAGYAGWAGSLPPEEVERRLQQALELSQRSPQQLVDAVLPTLFQPGTPQPLVDEFAASMLEFHPVGLRAAARAFAAADLRDALPGIRVPTLLLYGDLDVRASVAVGRAIHRAIPGSRMVVLEGVGHVSTSETPERFDAEVRAFLTAC